ncbi:MAG: ABC transporter ATP-binding protein [Burkholderiaceae bacterium]|nr:ABC transporter ATP-binding protein [Burkholderiaceae bacterium]
MSVHAPVIEVAGLSKCFHTYNNPGDRLRQALVPPLQRWAGKTPTQYYSEFWALREVSLSVGRNETVGIVGRNGSGKSTLLQCICGTLTPTVGTVRTHGRVAALLELGSGFNPEFSGRDNVFMNAAVLGLGRAEVEQRFDAIAAFADIGAFLEQPVKTYSSGMAVRLAFAVAINLSPDILVVDEALSVGDELFQRKCFARIETLKADGMTVLFVSHSGATVVELCDRAILLDGGELLAVGKPGDVVSRYQKLLYAPATDRQRVRDEMVAALQDKGGNTHSGQAAHIPSPDLLQNKEQQNQAAPALKAFFDAGFVPSTTLAYASRGAHILAPAVFTLAGEQVNALVRGERYVYRYRVAFEVGANQVRFGMLIKTLSGVQLSGAVSAPSIQASLAWVGAGQTLEVAFEFDCLMNPGTYFLSCGVLGLVDGEECFLHRIVDAIALRVLPQVGNTSTELVSLCAFQGFTPVETQVSLAGA